MTIDGRCCFSNAGSRERPPLVVSPLMLALTTVYFDPLCCNWFASSCTHPWPRCNPYSADRLSPSTRITGRSLLAVALVALELTAPDAGAFDATAHSANANEAIE